jgi:4-alpha-glucanotransferase
MLYELDVRAICHNLLATLARRPEAYHRKIGRRPANGNGQCASIHDRVVFKQAGARSAAAVRPLARKSLLDHFFDPAANARGGQPRAKRAELGDFVRALRVEASVRATRPDAGPAVRDGRVAGREVRSPRASRSKRAARRWKSPTCWKTCRPGRRCNSPSS